jgi:hypothetical protein
MYKKVLFGSGAKSFSTYKYKRGGGSYGSCGSGSGSNIDNYLLGLVRNVSINSKPKKKGRGGGGLKFCR